MGRVTRGQEIFYERNFTCPVDRKTFVGFRMFPTVKERLERRDPYFDDVYFEPARTSTFTDYLLMMVRVCPGCGFASSEDSFYKVDDPYIATHDWEKTTLNGLQIQSAPRTDLLKEAQDLYVCPRSPEDTVLAYKAAILTSTALYNIHNRRHSGELIRMGNYGLTLARIDREYSRGEMYESWLRAAMEYFTRALQTDVKGDVRYRGLYQLAAVSIRLDENRLASRVFEILRAMAKKETSGELKRWFARVRSIWENRDMHRKAAEGS